MTYEEATNKMIELDKIYNMDCLEGMKMIPDGSVDAVICDLPYGTTACKWDVVIPFEPLWEQYHRICKPNAAIVLFGSEPFSSALRMSNIKAYRYDWVWEKGFGGNFLQAKRQPIKTFENVMVFGFESPRYYPQMIKRDVPIKKGKNSNNAGDAMGEIRGEKARNFQGQIYTEKYPEAVIYFNSRAEGHDTKHPTQKPVDLLRYLVLTYTNEGDTVLDNCMGSGTTAVACIKEKRHFIGFELNKEYYEKACKRIRNEQRQLRLF
jgi:site-specific DNA-methyltransferase (adenine-specific)